MEKNETYFLYSIDQGEFKEQQDIFVEFEPNPFSCGTYRYCYKGKILDENRNLVRTEDFKNGRCVVKIPKSGTGSYNYKLDFICSEFANELAQAYNEEVSIIPDKINFLLPYGAKLDIFNENNNIYNNIVSVEPFLEGKYIKFYNNDGAPFKEFPNLTAFCHYTWMKNQGRKVITDIQGVKISNKFYLTDPACQSIEQEYGESDLGVQGLIKFLLYHKCNSICKEWRWIDINQFFSLTGNEKASIKLSKYRFQQIKNEKYLPKYLQILKLINF